MKVYLDVTELEGEPKNMIDKDEDHAALHRQVKEDILEFGPTRGTKDALHADIRAPAGWSARAGEFPESPAIVMRKNDTYADYGIGDIEDSSSVQHKTTARPERFKESESHFDAETNGRKEHSPQLLSWLDQCVPNSPRVSAVEMIRQEEESETLVAKQLEVKEMEFFHSVHLSTGNSDNRALSCHTGDKPTEAQLYLRNILDRYPLIPLYLANRLAIANKGRAERLRKLRLEHKHDCLRSSSYIQDTNSKYGMLEDDHHHTHDHGVTLEIINRISNNQNGTFEHLPSDPKRSHTPPSSLLSFGSGSRAKSREKEGQNSKTKLKHVWDNLFHEDSALALLLRGLGVLLIEKIEPRDSLLITPQKMQLFYRRFKLPVEAYPWDVVFDDKISAISRMYRDLRCQHHLVQGDNFDGRPDIPALTPLGFYRWATVLIQAHPYEEFSRLEKIFLDSSTTDPRDGKQWFPRDFTRTTFALSLRLSAHELLEESILEHCQTSKPCQTCIVATKVGAPRANLMLILTIWQEPRVFDDAAVLERYFQCINDFTRVGLRAFFAHSGQSPCELCLWVEQSAEDHKDYRVLKSVRLWAKESLHWYSEKQLATAAEYNNNVVERFSERGRNWSQRAASRASSVHSRTSSWNSTLHGSSEFDPSEQILDDREVSASATGSTDSASNFEIPHPPKELGPMPFECDICGKEIFIEGRRAWK